MDGKRGRYECSSGRSSLTCTPKQPAKRPRSVLSSLQLGTSDTRSSARRSLTAMYGSEWQGADLLASTSWSPDEVVALLKFLIEHGYTERWPFARKDSKLWSEAASFVHRNVHSKPLRSDSACRYKVTKSLSRAYGSPQDAYSHFVPVSLSTPASRCLQTIDTLFSSLTNDQRLEILSQLFEKLATLNGVKFPPDYLHLSIKAARNFSRAGRSNMLSNLAKAAGTLRDDGSDALLPLKRLPTGLIEHSLNFFTASSIAQIECPLDYKQWLVSMFCLFGTKFIKLFSGPMWAVATTAQSAEDSKENMGHLHPIEAKVNIPGLSVRTLERYVAGSGVSLGSEVQVQMLDAAAKSQPYTKWWIKGDGCDLVSGLTESVRLEWAGDVDLDDGLLQESYDAYIQRLNFLEEIGVGSRSDPASLDKDLKECLQILRADKEFLLKSLLAAQTDYEARVGKTTSTDKGCFESGWKLEELNVLRDTSQQLIVDVQSGIDNPTQLAELKSKLRSFVRNLSRQQRVPASHIFVIMISSEERNIKPYAIPIQCIPYASMHSSTMRRVLSNTIQLMKDRNMKVAGFTSNGEYNSMRNMGYTRPLSVLKIRSDVRAKYGKLSKRTMMRMITPIFVYGDLVSQDPNPAVPVTLLAEIVVCQSVNMSWQEILKHIRARTVPNGYRYHNWKPGQKTEDEVDMLRSVLSQLEFTYLIRKYDAEGIPFRSHLHVPENHPITGSIFFEREDPGHVLKRIANCTRNGGHRRLKLERFQETLEDEKANLSYSALVGSRKQSVEDAERLLSVSMAEFMECKGYDEEAKYIRAVNGWRRACDERGLTELQRCRYNYLFLNYIIADWMPWYKSDYDFSLLEVNRDVTSICGFTREVLTAVIADIETVEWKRCVSSNPENPRASTTDDVECFFSVLRDQLGKHFTLKQVKFEWRKVCNEFQKRTDPELPYYYYTSNHDRFYEGQRPSFNEPSKAKKRKHRVPRRERLLFVSGRASLPQRGSGSVRSRFHNVPLELPPLAPTHLSEHSYH